MVDGGLRPVTEEETIAIRNKAARAIQAVFRELGLPLISDEEVEAATYAHGSKDMPARNVVEDLAAVEEMMKRNITGLDIVGALSSSGFEDIASNILNMLRQRVTGDYLQTSAILDRQFDVVSAVNDINDYQGPAPAIASLPNVGRKLKILRAWFSPLDRIRRYTVECTTERKPVFTLQVSEGEAAKADERVDEVVIGVGPPLISISTKH